MNKIWVGVSAAAAMMLSGCVAVSTVDRVPSLVTAPPARIQAVGHGAQSSYGQYSAGQARLMAMRAAQVDAYRALAEQVYGYRVSGTTTVSSFMTQHDSVRTYVEAFMRGTRLVSNLPIGDGNYEATVEIDLPMAFSNCVTHFGQISDCRGTMPIPTYVSSM